MRKDASPSPPAEDVIWLCRRLASALQAGTSIISALDRMKAEAPDSLSPYLSAMRQRVGSGDCMGRGLAELGLPAFVWGSILGGEVTGTLASALPQLADRLELEHNLMPLRRTRLNSYALALGRLGLMLGLHVPMLTGVESAADSLPDPGAVRDMGAVFRDVRTGADLSDALQRHCSSLPDLTIDMIRDAEREGRLPDALPIVADYLLDAAGEARPRRKKQEARNGS
jgi:type II secretory pathway component PulF